MQAKHQSAREPAHTPHPSGCTHPTCVNVVPRQRRVEPLIRQQAAVNAALAAAALAAVAPVALQ